jgi:hypothetical protein
MRSACRSGTPLVGSYRGVAAPAVWVLSLGGRAAADLAAMSTCNLLSVVAVVTWLEGVVRRTGGGGGLA